MQASSSGAPRLDLKVPEAGHFVLEGNDPEGKGSGNCCGQIEKGTLPTLRTTFSEVAVELFESATGFNSKLDTSDCAFAKNRERHCRLLGLQFRRAIAATIQAS
jgi:hypothetical protein